MATKPAPKTEEAARLMAHFLAGISYQRKKNFPHLWRKFAEFMQAPTPEEALGQILSMDGAAGNAKAQLYRLWLQSSGKSKGGVECYIAGLRTFMRYCQRVGAIDWTLTYAAAGKPRKVLADLVSGPSDPVSPIAGNSMEAKAARLIQQVSGTLRSENTRRAFDQALMHFSTFLRVKTVGAALAKLLARCRGQANSMAMDYQAWMTAQKLSSGTISQRLAILRGYVKRAYMNGLISWHLEIQGPKVESYADLSGPAPQRISEVLEQLAELDDAISKRNRAIILMLYGMGLRVSEARELDLKHLDLEGLRVSIKGKGREGREWVGLPKEVAEALKAWLLHRGLDQGPLYVGWKEGKRLTRESIWRVTTGWGLGRPHGLRHSGITRALDLCNGDYRKVRAFSRHKRVETILKYDDHRNDYGGQIAAAVAGDITGTPSKPAALAPTPIVATGKLRLA
jgi:integrase/recombinase XerC